MCMYESATMVDTQHQFGFEVPIAHPMRPRCWRLWDTPPKQSRSIGFQENVEKRPESYPQKGVYMDYL